MGRGGGRGRKKTSLRNLSREKPTEQELNALNTARFEAAHPIATAIISAVLVEHELERLLERRLASRDDDLWQSLTADNGALSTFYRKIQMARALKIIDPATETNLQIVRVIRNAFAHSKKLIDFDHELVEAELKSISIPRYAKRGFRAAKSLKLGNRQAFLVLCHHLALHLLRKGTTALQRANKRWMARNRPSPLAMAFMSSNATQKPNAGFLQQLVLGDQSAGPMSKAPPLLMGGLFGLGEELLRKNDK
jgi:hypothetical protein